MSPTKTSPRQLKSSSSASIASIGYSLQCDLIPARRYSPIFERSSAKSPVDFADFPLVLWWSIRLATERWLSITQQVFTLHEHQGIRHSEEKLGEGDCRPKAHEPKRIVFGDVDPAADKSDQHAKTRAKLVSTIHGASTRSVCVFL